MEGSRRTRPDADTEFGLEVTIEERSGDGRTKKGSHDRSGSCRADNDLAEKQKSSFEELFHPQPSPPKPLRALALPFIKTRPLVPKKFENPKKAHIAPSQRLVAKVHPSHTSLSKGILFFVSSKEKGAHTLPLPLRNIAQARFASTPASTRFRSLRKLFDAESPQSHIQNGSRKQASSTSRYTPATSLPALFSHCFLAPRAARQHPATQIFDRTNPLCGDKH